MNRKFIPINGGRIIAGHYMEDTSFVLDNKSKSKIKMEKAYFCGEIINVPQAQAQAADVERDGPVFKEYCERFFEARPLDNDRAGTYITRLKRLFRRWMETSRVQHNCHRMMEIIVRDKFLSTINDDLRMLVMLRMPETLDELEQLSEEYHAQMPGAKLCKAEPEEDVDDDKENIN